MMKQLCDVLIDDPSYHSYMVRLWRTPGIAEPLWSCEVEDIQSGEIVGMASLEELFSWIGQALSRDAEKYL